MINVAFNLPAGAGVSFALYDVTGRRVDVRREEFVPTAGDHAVAWALPSLASGVYLLRVVTDAGLQAQRKLVIAR